MSFMTRTIPMRHAAPRLALAATLAFAAAAATTASAQGPVPPYQSTDPKMRAASASMNSSARSRFWRKKAGLSAVPRALAW